MARRIKVLHCIETMGSGGVEQLKLTVSKYINSEKFEQRIICSKILYDYDKRFLKYGIASSAIGDMKSPFNIPYYLRLIREVRKYKPDIIHGAVFEGVISAVVAGLICRVPVIIVEETSQPLNRSWRGHVLLRLLSFFADAVLAISPSVKKYLIDVARIPERKVILTSYAVDKPRSPSPGEIAVTKQQLGIGEKDFIIGTVGRLRDFHKRFSVLIKALGIIKPLHPDVKLMIVGDGDDRKSLEQLAISLDVRDKVIFAGYQADTPLFYACMNVFALVSHMEAFGLVVVEAMYMNLPVIGTSVGGIKDIVVPGETGYLVEPHNVKQTAEAIISTYERKEGLLSMGAAGYTRAEKYYSVKQYALQIQGLYTEMFNKVNV